MTDPNPWEELLNADASVEPPIPAEQRVPSQLDRTGALSEPNRLAQVRTDAFEGFSDGTALLIVQRAHSANQGPQVHLDFRLGSEHESKIESVAGLLSIFDLVQAAASSRSKTAWREAYLTASSMWDPLRFLRRWISRVLGAPGKQKLMIWDNTEFDVPWELFRNQSSLSPEDLELLDEHQQHRLRDHGWLGALLPVIRWMTVHDVGRPDFSLPERRDCVAGLLTMKNPSLDPAEDELGDFEVKPRTTDIWDLFGWLEDEDPSLSYGMVLIRDHGEPSDDLNRYLLAEVSYNEYANRSFRGLQRNKALVMLNACVAARPAAGRVEQLPRSFVEVFLRNGACAVIASTAEVDLRVSGGFAEDLLQEACDGAINVANWMFERRISAQEDAHAESRPSPGREDVFQLFFHTFMFAYFGHPETTLSAQRTDTNGSRA